MRTRHNSTLQSLPTIQINQSLKTQKYQHKSPPIIEIYDLEALEIDSQFSSLSSCSSTNEFNSINTTKPYHQQFSQQQQSNSLYSSSSASCSPRSSIESSSLFHSDSALEEPFTFREFISSIISCNEKKWHKLIIQDLARLLELNFRDFKKSFAANTKVSTINNNHNINNKSSRGTHSSIYLNTESDLFTYVAEKIFELASEEPNGILGTVINMRLQCENGQMYTISQGMPYDTSTIATSEITITLKEDMTSLKKFLQAIKCYQNVGRYLALHIDAKNFDTHRVRLY